MFTSVSKHRPTLSVEEEEGEKDEEEAEASREAIVIDQLMQHIFGPVFVLMINDQWWPLKRKQESNSKQAKDICDVILWSCDDFQWANMASKQT